MAIETEVKFPVPDIASLSSRLLAAGFRLQTPRTFESNVLYDYPDRRLRTRTEILRIRNYGGRWTMTHKRPPEGLAAEDLHKHRVETETMVADGQALAAVFRTLGLGEAFRYEKWRTEWADGHGHCVIDETPIGTYAELEGTDAWIDDAAARIGVAQSDYMTQSYGRLFDEWRKTTGSEATDLTFAAVSAGQ